MAKYTSNFLEKVILKLDFEDVSLLNLNLYQDQIKEVFDINTTQNGMEGSFNIDVVQGVVTQSKSELAVWDFRSTTKPNKRIMLSQKWISVEYDERSYIDSAELATDIDQFIQPFIDTLEVKLITRIGLRYINQITPPTSDEPLSWGDYINDNLIGDLAFAMERNAPLARSFTQQHYKLDIADLTFSYGIWNDDFPNTIATKSFILDFDCASLIPREISDIALKQEIKSYNQSIEEYFEATIKQPLRELMGIQE